MVWACKIYKRLVVSCLNSSLLIKLSQNKNNLCFWEWHNQTNQQRLCRRGPRLGGTNLYWAVTFHLASHFWYKCYEVWIFYILIRCSRKNMTQTGKHKSYVDSMEEMLRFVPPRRGPRQPWSWQEVGKEMIQCDYIYSNVIAHINDYHPDQTKLMDTKRMKWQSIRKIFLMYAEQPFKVMYATAILPLVRRGAQLPLLGKVFCSDNICNDTGLNHKTMCHRITSTEDGKPIILILTQPYKNNAATIRQAATRAKSGCSRNWKKSGIQKTLRQLQCHCETNWHKKRVHNCLPLRYSEVVILLLSQDNSHQI